jgi:site-specific DNA-cytosine methylase
VGPGELALIIGGPPCQGFSSIRPFRSATEDDPRNTLFEQFASFANWFRPRALVMENVVGLATHQGGGERSSKSRSVFTSWDMAASGESSTRRCSEFLNDASG